MDNSIPFPRVYQNAVREIPNFNMSTQRNDVVDIYSHFRCSTP